MEMRPGFMPRVPRERGGLMRPGPGFPFRGRGVMLMDRPPRLPPRPGMLRGPPPFGRGLLPHGRPRLGPVMLPRPPPLGHLGPLGPRGLMPRPMLPPPHRHLHPDMMEMPDLPNAIMPKKEAEKKTLNETKSASNIKQSNINQSNQANKTNRTEKVIQNVNQQTPGSRKNRKDSKNRKTPVAQQAQQTPPPPPQPPPAPSIKGHLPVKPSAQSSHTSPLKQITQPSSKMQQPPPQQNVPSMNQPPVQKHMNQPPVQKQHTSPIQTPMNTNIRPQQAPQHLMSQPPRGGRINNMNHQRIRGNAPVAGHVGIPNAPPPVNMNPHHQGPLMNHGPPNVPVHGGVAPVPPPRPNVMMNGPPPPPPQFSTAPPPTNYAAPPPVIAPQMPVKRGPPPMGPPPVMQPKRVRYEAPPPPSNGYMQYQQQPPPQQQQVYQSYDVPPPTDVYHNMPPANVNVAPQQVYPAQDYHNYQTAPPQQNTSYNQNVNTQYPTSYNNPNNYSAYPTTTGYEQSVDYNTMPPQQTNVDPYGYSKPVDSYGYANTNYAAPQATGYEDYSSGYIDPNGYTSTVQDPSYGQTVGTYQGYSY